MNEELANVFDQLTVQFKKDQYRSRAYKKAANAIRNHPHPITSGSEAQKNIAGIGKSIAAKIDEYLSNGSLAIIENRPPEEKEKDRIVKEFEGIYGVGPVTAEKWYNKGHRSIKDLKEIYPTMTDGQKLGYYYYYHLKERIPREEMDKIATVISELCEELKIVHMICGSYRRGEPSSGDIDCLIKGKNPRNLTKLVTQLVNRKIIVGHLAIGESKYMGILKLGDKYNARRIDIMTINDVSWPYATLYFTGSKQLNVTMRTQALKLGLTMNEYRMIDKEGNPFLAKTERDIFQRLDMDYLEPSERSIGKK